MNKQQEVQVDKSAALIKRLRTQNKEQKNMISMLRTSLMIANHHHPDNINRVMDEKICLMAKQLLKQ